MSPEQVKGEADRRALRHLLARRDALPDGDRRAALHRQHAVRGHGPAHAEAAQAGPRSSTRRFRRTCARSSSAAWRSIRRCAMPRPPRSSRTSERRDVSSRRCGTHPAAPMAPARRRPRPRSPRSCSASSRGGRSRIRRAGAPRRGAQARIGPDRRLRKQDGRPGLRRDARAVLRDSRSRAPPSSRRTTAAAPDKLAAQLQPGATKLTEPLARLVAVREGFRSSRPDAIEKQGRRLPHPVRAVDAATGKAIVDASAEASGKDDVLGGRGEGSPPRSARRSATRHPPPSSSRPRRRSRPARSRRRTSTRSLRTSSTAGNWDEAIRHYRKAIDLDPNLGRAYAGIAAVESNRGNRAEAEKYYKEAFARIDRMSDREKYRTRGGYYLIEPEPGQRDRGVLRAREAIPGATLRASRISPPPISTSATWPGRSRRRAARCSSTPRTCRSGTTSVWTRCTPGTSRTAIKEQDEVLRLNPKFVLAYVSKAMSAGRARARPTRPPRPTRKPRAVDARGASVARMGLADIAMYQGRSADAAADPRVGRRARTSTNKDSESAAVKLLAAAEVHLESRERAGAIADAERAISLARAERTSSIPPRASSSRAGRDAKALALATELGRTPRARPAGVRRADPRRGRARARARPRRRSGTSSRRKKIADTWAGRLDLGKAYLDGRRLRAGGRRARGVREAARRGDRALPGRVADVPPLPDGVLLPGPRARGAQEPGRGGCLQGVSLGEDRRRRRPRRRRPQAASEK